MSINKPSKVYIILKYEAIDLPSCYRIVYSEFIIRITYSIIA